MTKSLPCVCVCVCVCSKWCFFVVARLCVIGFRRVQVCVGERVKRGKKKEGCEEEEDVNGKMRADQEKCAHVTYRVVGGGGDDGANAEIGECTEMCAWPRILCPIHHDHRQKLQLHADQYGTLVPTDVSSFICSCYPLHPPLDLYAPIQPPTPTPTSQTWTGWQMVAVPFLVLFSYVAFFVL
jgi:hypothetical protein